LHDTQEYYSRTDLDDHEYTKLWEAKQYDAARAIRGTSAPTPDVRVACRRR